MFPRTLHLHDVCFGPSSPDVDWCSWKVSENQDIQNLKSVPTEIAIRSALLKIPERAIGGPKPQHNSKVLWILLQFGAAARFRFADSPNARSLWPCYAATGTKDESPDPKVPVQIKLLFGCRVAIGHLRKGPNSDESRWSTRSLPRSSSSRDFISAGQNLNTIWNKSFVLLQMQDTKLYENMSYLKRKFPRFRAGGFKFSMSRWTMMRSFFSGKVVFCAFGWQ